MNLLSIEFCNMLHYEGAEYTNALFTTTVQVKRAMSGDKNTQVVFGNRARIALYVKLY